MAGRILIIDAERSWGSRTKAHLEGLGHRCYWAQGIDEGVQAAEMLRPPALVLHALIATTEPWHALVARLRAAAGEETRILVHGVAAGEASRTASGPGRPDAVLGRFPEPKDLAVRVAETLALLLPRSGAAAVAAAPVAPVDVLETSLVLETADIAARPILPEELEPKATPLAPDPTATFQGELEETPVAYLLWHLHAEGATGELKVGLHEGALSLYLDEGRPVWVEGGGAPNVLGRVMERQGLLKPEAHRRALAELATRRGTGERFGDVLVRQGAITAETLDRGLALQVDAKLGQLFATGQAHYAFYEGRRTGGVLYPQSMVKVLLRGLSRIPRATLLARLQPSLNLFPMVDQPELPADFPARNAKTASLLGMLDGTHMLSDLLNLGDPNLPAMVLGLDAMRCLRYRVTAVPQGGGEMEAPQAGGAGDLSGLYLRVKGRSFYEALGLPPDARPEAIAAAQSRLEEAVSERGLKEQSISQTGRMRVGELREIVRSMKATLNDREARSRYDAALASTGAADRREEFHVEEQLKRAQKLMADESWEAAHDVLAKLPGSENAEVLAALGYSLYMRTAEAGRAGVASRALGLVRQAAALQPQYAMAAYYAGEILRQEGRVDEALRCYRVGLTHQPDNPRLQRAAKLLTPTGGGEATAGTYVLFASDVLCEGADPELEDRLRDLHARAFTQALEKQLSGILQESGASFARDACLFESRGKRLCALPLDVATLTPGSRSRLLGFAPAFKKALERHLAKAVADLPSLAPRTRVSIVAGEGTIQGDGPGRRMAGALPSRALMAAGKDSGVMGTDAATLGALVGATAPDDVARNLEPLGLHATLLQESAGSDNPIYVLTGAARVASAPEEPVAPTRALEAVVSRGEIASLQSLDRLLSGSEERIRAIFVKLAGAQEAAPSVTSGRLWGRVVGKGSTRAPGPEGVRLRTRLFEPILKGSRVFLGLGDLLQWVRLLDAVGRQYTDALFSVQEAFRLKRKELWTGAKLTGGYADLERLRPEQLLAVSEACRLFGGTFDPADNYEDCTFAELTSRAAGRVRALMGQGFGSSSSVALTIVDIYDGAIDTPDDSIDPVSIFEFFAVVSLIGVTEGIRAYEVEHLADSYKPGTPKYDRALQDINESFDQYAWILRAGLSHYARIKRIFSLRPPAAGDRVESVFGTKFELPLYEHLARE